MDKLIDMKKVAERPVSRPKSWGEELLWANDAGYYSKLLFISKAKAFTVSPLRRSFYIMLGNGVLRSADGTIREVSRSDIINGGADGILIASNDMIVIEAGAEES